MNKSNYEQTDRPDPDWQELERPEPDRPIGPDQTGVTSAEQRLTPPKKKQNTEYPSGSILPM